LKNHINKKQAQSKKVPSDKASLVSLKKIQDNRPETALQLKLQGVADASTAKGAVLQQRANTTGLPDTLKSGIEHLSGHAMDDVKVHYNSDKPAQLNAHAYAQGSQIHLASGQEKHLPHEAWHVVQQKQGRVQPTAEIKEKVVINDDRDLERKADIALKAASGSYTLDGAITPFNFKQSRKGSDIILKSKSHPNGKVDYSAYVITYLKKIKVIPKNAVDVTLTAKNTYGIS
jgi:hypothetical protein